MNLSEFHLPFQIPMPDNFVPRALHTKSFVTGASGVETIESRADGVEVRVRDKRGELWALIVTGGGHGWRQLEKPKEPEPEPVDPLACGECAFVGESAAGLAAHRRSHQRKAGR